ncbi:MAG: SoxR reducing system RseC family protein [Sphaerochaetaceae bacterium]|nr:SoxR reducing system RseC family protein [Spirochaetales bacterium]MDY5498611.1 SoxR reducing system RseC family protein [Sphaerochaetaceae bacterium]
MYEQVIVKEVISKDLVKVSCSTSACTGCKSAAFCNTKGREFEATNDKRFPLESGMVVSLYLPPARTIASTLITLMVPLLGFPLFYFLSSSLGEKGATLLGFLGVAVGFVLVAIYFRHQRRRYLPSVASVIG